MTISDRTYEALSTGLLLTNLEAKYRRINRANAELKSWEDRPNGHPWDVLRKQREDWNARDREAIRQMKAVLHSRGESMAVRGVERRVGQG